MIKINLANILWIFSVAEIKLVETNMCRFRNNTYIWEIYQL